MYGNDRIENHPEVMAQDMLEATTRPIDATDPLDYSGQAPEVFWERAAQGEAASGFGTAAECSAGTAEEWGIALSRVLAIQVTWFGDEPRPPGPWFGGFAFQPRSTTSALWAGFPAARWIVPELLIWRRQGRCYETRFRWVGPPPELAAAETAAGGQTREEPPSVRSRWCALVGRALQQIEAGVLEKVVLARAVDLTAEQLGEHGGLQRCLELDVRAALRRLRGAFPSCRTFLLTGTNGDRFFGATPELLCTVRGRELTAEALAGTASPTEASALGDDPKNLREHQSVVRAIREALAPLTDELEVAVRPSIMTLRNVAHLRTPISGVLRPQVGLAEVALALHPTPAVGGAPRSAALAFIEREEELDRGWYGGAVGAVGQGDGELAVALRCALQPGERACRRAAPSRTSARPLVRLFVGAGVVRGSRPEGEWEETELKSQAVRQAVLHGLRERADGH